MRDHRKKRAGGLVLAMFLSLVSIPQQLFSQGLTSAEQDGFLIWLHALESTIASREAAGLSEDRLLYPGGIKSAPESREPSLLDVARSLEELESQPRLLQEPTPRSALHALNRARNYLSLAEYDSALVWYETTVQRDAQAEFALDMGREMLSTAIALRSVPTVRRHIQDLLHQSSAEKRESELELAFRFMLATCDTSQLNDMLAQLAARKFEQSGQIRYWRAFSLNWLGRWAESLALLKELVASDGYSYGLDEAQRAWVLTAIADQTFLTGTRDAATPLYRALAASSLGELAIWAACQVAAFDLMEGRFLEAGTALERLCRMKENATWRQHACRLAALSDELQRLRDEGRPHGADVYYKP